MTRKQPGGFRIDPVTKMEIVIGDVVYVIGVLLEPSYEQVIDPEEVILDNRPDKRACERDLDGTISVGFLRSRSWSTVETGAAPPVICLVRSEGQHQRERRGAV